MKISIQKTAKIATYGNKNKAKTLWIVLHGYGQLVDYFIRHFHVLDENENFVVAPEGIHRFYLNGTAGRVGASWMTKEERLDDIDDNISYLNQVFKAIYNPKIVDKIVVLGFSQGASTLARWIQKSDFNPTALILWAGVFPPDLELKANANKFKELPTYFVVGKKDKYFQGDELTQIKSDLAEKEIHPKWIKFDGEHTIDATVLLDLEKTIRLQESK